MTADSTASAPITYVSFSAEIDSFTTESLIAVMADSACKGIQEVYLMLSTPGGSVMNGLNLYNVLKALPFKLTTHNVGNVDSIGIAVFLAGDTRYASPQSTFMFHGVGVPHVDRKRIGAVIEDRTNLTSRQVTFLFRRAQTKDPAYAAGCGIIHEIKDVEIPAGSPVVSLVFQHKSAYTSRRRGHVSP